MLDDVTLSAKLTIAVEWFRRARSGEFSLAPGGREAGKFEELLDGCVADAAVLEQLSLVATVQPGTQVRFPDGRTRDPLVIAQRALRSDRDAIGLPIDDIMALAFVVQTLLPPAAPAAVDVAGGLQ